MEITLIAIGTFLASGYGFEIILRTATKQSTPGSHFVAFAIGVSMIVVGALLK